MENGIYHDISTRTGGDIYIGVVGSHRQINLYQALYGDHGLARHGKHVQTGAGA